MASYLSKKNKSVNSSPEGNSPSTSPNSSVNNLETNTNQQTIQMNSNSSQNGNSQSNPNNAPKFGTLVPNRVFVGGISGNTTEHELAQLFSAYGNVKATKVISDRAGVSKGYGFVTFETEEEAKRLMQDSDGIVLKERKLNIAPAIKKQPFSRSFDAPSPPIQTSNTVFYPNGVPITFHNGMAYFPSMTPPITTTSPLANSVEQVPVYPASYGPPQPQPTISPATAYSVCYPYTQAMYVPTQYPYQIPYDPYFQTPGQTAHPYIYHGHAPPGNGASGQASNGGSSASGPPPGSGGGGGCQNQGGSAASTAVPPPPPHSAPPAYYPGPGDIYYAAPTPSQPTGQHPPPGAFIFQNEMFLYETSGQQPNAQTPPENVNLNHTNEDTSIHTSTAGGKETTSASSHKPPLDNNNGSNGGGSGGSGSGSHTNNSRRIISGPPNHINGIPVLHIQEESELTSKQVQQQHHPHHPVAQHHQPLPPPLLHNVDYPPPGAPGYYSPTISHHTHALANPHSHPNPHMSQIQPPPQLPQKPQIIYPQMPYFPGPGFIPHTTNIQQLTPHNSIRHTSRQGNKIQIPPFPKYFDKPNPRGGRRMFKDPPPNTNYTKNSSKYQIPHQTSHHHISTNRKEEEKTPPPAPYSPHSRMNPTMSPQLQFPARNNTYYQPAQPSQMHPHAAQSQQRRYQQRKPTSQNGKKYKMNGAHNNIISNNNNSGSANSGSNINNSAISPGGAGDNVSINCPSPQKLIEEVGSGDAKSLIPLTPPSTPRIASAQTQEVTHQIAALSI